jgi:cyclase
MNHDGTRNGYAVAEYAALSERLSIPVIASGGAGSIGHIVEVLSAGKADAALAASIFHFGEISIPALKQSLREAGIAVRL